MKSQDIVLLLKLITLQKQELGWGQGSARRTWPDDWQDWEDDADPSLAALISADRSRFQEQAYSMRHLEQETGISKSQVSESLRRCFDVGLAKRDRKSGVPRANTKALLEFLIFGIRYVFPARAGALTRGIGTSFAAPVLKEKLMSGGELIPVWPDAQGQNKGLAVVPLASSVPHAVRRDPELYGLLALVDALRLGNSREANLAAELLKQLMDWKA